MVDGRGSDAACGGQRAAGLVQDESVAGAERSRGCDDPGDGDVRRGVDPVQDGRVHRGQWQAIAHGAFGGPVGGEEEESPGDPPRIGTQKISRNIAGVPPIALEWGDPRGRQGGSEMQQ